MFLCLRRVSDHPCAPVACRPKICTIQPFTENYQHPIPTRTHHHVHNPVCVGTLSSVLQTSDCAACVCPLFFPRCTASAQRLQGSLWGAYTNSPILTGFTICSRHSLLPDSGRTAYSGGHGPRSQVPELDPTWVTQALNSVLGF